MQVLCINICCPHGFAFKFNTTLGDYSCDEDPGSSVYHPRFFNRYEEEVQLELNTDYYLTAPSPQYGRDYPKLYKCPQHQTDYLGITFAPEDLGEFQLKTSGNLVGEKEAMPEWAVRGRSFIPENARRRFKRELEMEMEGQSQPAPVLERVKYQTDEVNTN